ncbi:MAG: WD40 repeat domain-containing protein [Candidatus Njordarchaeota archaeon]
MDEESVGNILLAEAIPSKREGYFYSQQFWENGAKKVREIIQKAIMTKKSIEKIVGILEEDIDNIIAKTKTVNIDGYITSIDFLEKLAQEYHNNKVSEIAKILRIPYQTLAKMLIRTWLAKAEIGEVKITLSHDAAVTAYAFSPNAKYIATASRKDKIVIWNTEKMEPHATFPNRYHIHAIVFSPNSRLLALRGNDQLIIIDISQKAIITQGKYNDYYGRCWMAFTPDSKKIIIADGYAGRIWIEDIFSDQKKFVKDEHTKTPYSVAVSPDNKYIAYTRFIYEWDAAELFAGKEVSSYGVVIRNRSFEYIKSLWCEKEYPIEARSRPPMVRFSPDGRYLAYWGQILKVWSLPDFRIVDRDFDSAVIFGTVSPDGKYYAVPKDKNFVLHEAMLYV